MLTRRDVLVTGAAALATPGITQAAPRQLTAAPASAQLVPEGHPATSVWAFDGEVPGPVLRCRQGELFALRFRNDLPEPSAIHWHGIRLPNAMDGVPYLTQDPVAPGATFDYAFTPPDAGTYWYHSHNRSWEQVARGLQGPLIVEEATPPDVDQDLILVLDDWRLDAEAALADDFGSMRDWSHAGRLGNWVTVNGAPEPAFPTVPGQRLRLRLINTANARVFTLSAKGLSGWVMALDGAPLGEPMALERITLAPAQRADLMVDVTPDGEAPVLISHERDGGFALATFPATGPAQALRTPPPALPANPLPELGDLTAVEPVELVMQGGAMGRMAEATFEGQTLPIRELVRKGYAWALNGTAGLPEAPLVEAARGQTIRLRLINDTAWPHGMHLHGHHFRTLDPEPGPWRDTILIGRNETREIAFVADNPGDWLLHCHMLEHAAAGMMSWIRVT